MLTTSQGRCVVKSKGVSRGESPLAGVWWWAEVSADLSASPIKTYQGGWEDSPTVIARSPGYLAISAMFYHETRDAETSSA
jgi:hypothetical protein